MCQSRNQMDGWSYFYETLEADPPSEILQERVKNDLYRISQMESASSDLPISTVAQIYWSQQKNKNHKFQQGIRELPKFKKPLRMFEAQNDRPFLQIETSRDQEMEYDRCRRGSEKQTKSLIRDLHRVLSNYFQSLISNKQIHQQSQVALIKRFGQSYPNFEILNSFLGFNRINLKSFKEQAHRDSIQKHCLNCVQGHRILYEFLTGHRSAFRQKLTKIKYLGRMEEIIFYAPKDSWK